MTTFVISYDLRKPTRNYEPLYEALRNIGAVRILESVWLAESTHQATAIRDYLRQHADSDDWFLVLQIGTDWATWGCEERGVNWLKQRFP